MRNRQLQETSAGEDIVAVSNYHRSASGSILANYGATGENYTISSPTQSGGGTQSDTQTGTATYSHSESGNFTVAGGVFTVNITSLVDSDVSHLSAGKSWNGSLSVSGVSGSTTVDPVDSSRESLQ